MITDDNDGPPQLSSETLKALQEWQQEQEQNKANDEPQEDWVSELINFILFEIQICMNFFEYCGIRCSRSRFQ